MNYTEFDSNIDKFYLELFEKCWKTVSHCPEFSGISKPKFFKGSTENRGGVAVYNTVENHIILNQCPVEPNENEKLDITNTIFHELCHVIQPSHGDSFVKLFAKFYRGSRDQFIHGMMTSRHVDYLRAQRLRTCKEVKAFEKEHPFDKEAARAEIEKAMGTIL